MNKLLFTSLFCISSLMAQTPATLSPEEQIAELQKSTQPTLVKVTASWCGPCRQMEPTLNEVKKTFEETVQFQEFAVENLMKGTDEGAKALKEAFDVSITMIPTFMLFKDGKMVKVLVGSRNKEELTERLNKLVTTKTEDLLKEEREDIPEAFKNEMPSKEKLEKIRDEIIILKAFLTDPIKNKNLHAQVIESKIFKELDQNIATITKLINNLQV